MHVGSICMYNTYSVQMTYLHSVQPRPNEPADDTDSVSRLASLSNLLSISASSRTFTP